MELRISQTGFFLLCKTRYNSDFLKKEKPKKGLTCTHSCFIPRLICRIVAIKALVWVTDFSFITGLTRLLGTHLAASTAILHQAHPGGAGWHRWASAGPVAYLFALMHLTDSCGFVCSLSLLLPGAGQPATKLSYRRAYLRVGKLKQVRFFQKIYLFYC